MQRCVCLHAQIGKRKTFDESRDEIVGCHVDFIQSEGGEKSDAGIGIVQSKVQAVLDLRFVFPPVRSRIGAGVQNGSGDTKGRSVMM